MVITGSRWMTTVWGLRLGSGCVSGLMNANEVEEEENVD